MTSLPPHVQNNDINWIPGLTSLFYLFSRAGGIASAYRNDARQVAVNHVAEHYGAGTGTARFVGVPGTGNNFGYNHGHGYAGNGYNHGHGITRKQTMDGVDIL